jgi:hypothetical protein
MDPNKDDNLDQIHENNKNCAPNKLFESGSCYTLNSLIKMGNAFNKDNPNNIIKLNQSYETLHPHKYKKYLVNQFQKKLSKGCSNQKCWTEQSFMRHLDKLSQEEIERYTFRPDGPEGKFEWLSTLHIDEVMEQYEKKHPEFKFLGAVPMDFDDLEVLGIKNLDFNKLIKQGKTKIGMVINLDEHYKSGSHWVSMFSDLKGGRVYYSDSYGFRPEKRVRSFMNRINRYNQTGLGIKNTEVDYNRIRQQYKNSECGIYSINFISRLLKGHTFKQICENPIPDEKINKCRSVYFTKE